MMTYEEIQKDSKEIINIICSSQRKIPGFFSMFGKVKYHFIIYCVLGGVSYFSLPLPKNIGLWLFFVAFGLFHWVVIFSFIATYANLSNMIGDERLKELSLVKVIARKINFYGLVWLVLLIVCGVSGIFTEWSILPLVIGNMIVTFLMAIVFNIDISRYQISSIIGAVKAVRNKSYN
ncbi:hypothetical protein [Mixta intestinalis]|uniref:Conjugal transfer entry exclusion protein TraS n=1 Tax=Mixta intestinalis TaxID=1615494 RepID=A0A6P1Q4W4_9GAMM|nr:hypothetical protein [Mixta intestinalis]QHM74016.1 hypothetical protein C7M51_04377 [Mixta intestinalis]